MRKVPTDRARGRIADEKSGIGRATFITKSRHCSPAGGKFATCHRRRPVRTRPSASLFSLPPDRSIRKRFFFQADKRYNSISPFGVVDHYPGSYSLHRQVSDQKHPTSEVRQQCFLSYVPVGEFASALNDRWLAAVFVRIPPGKTKGVPIVS